MKKLPQSSVVLLGVRRCWLPRHAVRMKEDPMTALCSTCGLGLTLIVYPTFDTVQGRQLKLEKKFALETKPGSRNKQYEHDPRKGTRTGHRDDGHVWRPYGPGRGKKSTRVHSGCSTRREKRRWLEELTECDCSILVSVCSRQ